MTWWAIDVRPDPSRREWLGAWLVARTGQAVEERDDGTLVTFAADERAADALVAELAAEAATPVETARRPVDAGGLDHPLARGLGARRFGRLTVVPSWVAGAGEPAAAHRGPRSRDRVRQRGARLDPRGADPARAPRAPRRPGARPRQRQRHPRDRRGQARRRPRRRHRERPRGQSRSRVRNAEPERGRRDRSSSSTATPATWRRCSVPPICSSPTSSARVNTALLPAIVRALRPGGLAIFSGMEQAEARAVPAGPRGRGLRPCATRRSTRAGGRWPPSGA